ncbi:MAG: serine/threonine-protein kinase, partial [Chloroflexi bacterium]|nr:serine/threonine-protein kinase [Chloroflexota bacterium]
MDLNDRTLGPYQIKGEIGRGGTAIVYRATDSRTGQDVALKILPPLSATDRMFLKRFIKEGQNAARLRHENIVRTYEAGEIDGFYYIAMEFVMGGTLAEMSEQRGQLFSINENINILSQIAAALDFAHSQGFLHRDIKPSNILMAEDGRVLLTDFGTAKEIVGDHTMMTGTGQRIGTPSFMSPEQISGVMNIDYRSDVYSLGVMAYKLFTGRLPLTAESQAELLHKIIYETPVSADRVNPELPPDIVHHLNRALAKDPKQRYESAGQFVATMVASQIWGSKLKAYQASTAVHHTSGGLVKRLQCKLPGRKALVRLVLAALLLLAIFVLPNLPGRELSLTQIQKRTVAQADYLSAILMGVFDSPQT